jgi:hypothetical protein
VGLFFSFLGLMVSVLGFVLRVPLAPSGLVVVVNVTWGMLETVSVSTVMVCVDPSGFDFICLEDMALDWRVTSGGAGTEEVRRDSILAALLSLPLSLVGTAGRGWRVRPSWPFCSFCSAVDDSFSSTWANSSAWLTGLGELGRLTSWTVSKAARAGVRIPDCS